MCVQEQGANFMLLAAKWLSKRISINCPLKFHSVRIDTLARVAQTAIVVYAAHFLMRSAGKTCNNLASTHQVICRRKTG